MKKRLYILAPNDRMNYGDLLFPYILTYYFSKQFDDIVYVSTTKSDLTKLGGIKTEAYNTLFDLDTKWENHLIVAGGESLCANWLTILSYINPQIDILRKLILKTRNKKLFLWSDSLIRTIYKIKTRFVFSVGKNELPQFQTISYNALGGSSLAKSHLLEDKNVQEILNSVDYFTVRDKVTSTALDKANIKHTICPDSAILMSEVFSEQDLLNHLSINASIANEKYIFFQGNLQIWKRVPKLAAVQLINIAKQTHCKICLCPIGTALGHSDQIALQQISKFIPKEYAFLIKRPNIFDIMWLIKHSTMYIGSSLHGTITAMSFNIPFIGYGPLKLKSYIQEWSRSSETRFVDKSAIKESALKFMHCESDFKDQKEIVKKNFEKLKHLYGLN